MTRDLFSPRERQVLTHLAVGASNKVIAHLMDISQDTVRSHIKSIFRKTGLENRTQVALWFVRLSQPGRLDDVITRPNGHGDLASDNMTG